MKRLSQIIALAIFVVTPIITDAQEAVEDTLPRVIEKLQSDISNLSKLKISGYMQVQYQHADSTALKSPAGEFEQGIENQLIVRRGRVKVAYTSGSSQYVLQLDATEKGLALKDAYLKFTEPWLNTFSFTGGIFNRPFGYEIELSSSVRESPERSRIYPTIFPNERDLGVCLTIQTPKTSPLNFIKLDAGFFNGSSAKKGKDFDNRKDFIGHITFNKTYLKESLKVGLGASYYDGSMINGTKYIYSMQNSAFDVDSADANATGYSKRKVYGFEGQLAYISSLGLTQIRAEYLVGDQPGTSSSSESAVEKPTKDTYNRKFAGYYVIFTQNILQTPLQLVAKYDVYDPNADISGNQIGAIDSKTNKADIKSSTLGLGLIYRFNPNIKFTAYYDIVKNESTALSGYTKDQKDNVFTLRVQYKF